MERRLLVADAVRDPHTEFGDALFIEGDQITAVGSVDEFRGASVPVTRLEGVIIPGLRDAHLHPVGYTAALQRPSLKAAADFDQLSDIIADSVRQQPAGSAVTALRLDDESLAEQRLPGRNLLDAISSEHPILLMRYCGHIAVANTAALDLAGIETSTPDPAGGVIDRDDDGHPTGVLRETAFEPVTAALRPLAPPISPDDVITALTALAATGLTGIGAIAATDSGLWGGATSELDLLLEAADRSPITLQVLVIARTPEALRIAAEKIDRAGSRASFLGVKMFSDGSLGGHTAAMYEGFSDRPAELGTDRLDPAWAESMAQASLDIGGRVAIHAIGDRANSGVLDLMEKLVDRGADPALLRIEHASVLTSGDIARFGRLGVTASVQPAFIASETGWLEKRLGPDRLRRTYAFRSVADAGAPLAGGSDSPVEPPHPLLGMAAARDRLGIVTDEALAPEAALELFTSGAAAAVGQQAELRPGAPADLTILSRDPLTATVDELRSARILATMVDGAQVRVPAGLETWQA